MGNEVTSSVVVVVVALRHRLREGAARREITQCFLLYIRSLCHGVFRRRIAAVSQRDVPLSSSHAVLCVQLASPVVSGSGPGSGKYHGRNDNKQAQPDFGVWSLKKKVKPNKTRS